MAATILSVLLALALTLAVYRPAEELEAEQTPTQTQALVIPIEIIDGEIWVAIPVEGMSDDLH